MIILLFFLGCHINCLECSDEFICSRCPNEFDLVKLDQITICSFSGNIIFNYLKFNIILLGSECYIDIIQIYLI